MNQVTKPSKEAVRQFLQDRRGMPPPSPAEIRRQLGWHLINVPVAQSVRAGAS